jgi:hypothetical protein
MSIDFSVMDLDSVADKYQRTALRLFGEGKTGRFYHEGRTYTFFARLNSTQRLATKLRKQAERRAHRKRVFTTHPPAVRYARAKFKTGKKHNPKKRQPLKLGIQ